MSDQHRNSMPLAKAFWLYGAGGLVATSLLVQVVSAVIFGVALVQGLSNPAPMLTVVGIIYGLATLAYILIVPRLVWRSAREYEGAPAWRSLSMIGVVLFCCYLLTRVGIFIYLLGHSGDQPL